MNTVQHGFHPLDRSSQKGEMGGGGEGKGEKRGEASSRFLTPTHCTFSIPQLVIFSNLIIQSFLILFSLVVYMREHTQTSTSLICSSRSKPSNIGLHSIYCQMIRYNSKYHTLMARLLGMVPTETLTS